MRDEACQSFRGGSAVGWGRRVTVCRLDGATPSLHYPLPKPRNARGGSLSEPPPSISHAIPTQPNPISTQNPQNSNDQTSNHETHPRELHAKLLGRQGQLPRNFARNSIGRSFNKL